ncbi:uncharacterized protein LOC135138371 isoform X2 [Zophobas morio]|uniref:uncharacterized protein LOC135138371 isoform X2 n=1 Tax=Zophobas morio TaxID=2755281 RepID=UPI003083E996
MSCYKKSFCYIEGTVVDKNAAEEVSELHENVWYRMKPPRQEKVMYAPFVSARQVDLVRNMLLGRTPLKVFDYERECKKKKEAKAAEELCRREINEKPDVKVKKSSVKFLNRNIYFMNDNNN